MMYISDATILLLLFAAFLGGIIIGFFVNSVREGFIRRNIRSDYAKLIAMITLNEIKSVVEQQVFEIINEIWRMHEKEKEKKDKKGSAKTKKQNTKVPPLPLGENQKM